MKNLRMLLAVFALTVAIAPAAFAQDVLVWATGNDGGDTAGLAADLQAFGYFSSVTASNDPNLTLADLLMYDRMLFFTNGCDGDMVAIGNILADYADTGRRLVVATFAWANQGCNTVDGRFVTDQISPFYYQGTTLYSYASMAWNDGHPFFNGVTSIDGFFRDDVALNPGATEHAGWSDGEPLLAMKGNVVGINLFPDDFYGDIAGDYNQLFANALGYGTVATETSSWGAVKTLYR